MVDLDAQLAGCGVTYKIGQLDWVSSYLRDILLSVPMRVFPEKFTFGGKTHLTCGDTIAGPGPWTE